YEALDLRRKIGDVTRLRRGPVAEVVRALRERRSLRLQGRDRRIERVFLTLVPKGCQSDLELRDLVLLLMQVVRGLRDARERGREVVSRDVDQRRGHLAADQSERVFRNLGQALELIAVVSRQILALDVVDLHEI